MVTSNSYLDIFLALVLSTTVMPVPEELPVIGAGVLCGHSDSDFANDRDNPARIRWWLMLPTVIVGAVIGDIVLYTIGRKWGKRILHTRWVERRLLTPEKRATIEQGFRDHGVKILLGVRLLPGIRGWVFVVAGSVRLPFWQFVLADAIYAIPLVNLMFWTAYWATDQIMVLVNEVNTYKSLVMSHLLAAVAGALIYKYLLARHVPTGDAQVPAIIAKPAHAIENAIESVAEAVTGRHLHDKGSDAGDAADAPPGVPVSPSSPASPPAP